MALLALNDTVQGWVYDITFFPRVWLCRRFVSETEKKNEQHAQKMAALMLS